MKPDPVSAYFDRFAPSWSDHYGPQGQMAGRVARFRDALSRFVPPDSAVLDFGCGSGDITVGLAGAWTMTAVDGACAMIEAAKSRPQPSVITWMQIEPGKPLPFPDASFQGVIASSVLEYVPNPKPLLAEFARILTPNGTLVFSVPDPRHPIRKTESRWALLSRIDWIYGLLKHTRWESQHTYLRISQTRWSHRLWSRALAEAGLRMEEVGLCSDPLMLIIAKRQPR